MVVLILASISMYFCWKHIDQLAKLYVRTKKKTKREKHPKANSSSDDSIYYNPLLDTNSDEEELNNDNKPENKKNHRNHEHNENHPDKRDKNQHMHVIHPWTVVSLIGNFFQIVGSFLALTYSADITIYISMLCGAGCLFECLYMGKYMSYDPSYATIYEILSRAFPVVIRYLVGTLPIFLGFLFFGLCVFWQSERFKDTSHSMFTLFAMIQGDSIFGTFTDLTNLNFFIGQVYLYFFCILFMIIVWNIFISIIEEAYVVTKIKNKSSWIFQYVQLEPKYVDMKIQSKNTLAKTRDYFNKVATNHKRKLEKSKSLKSYDLFVNKRTSLSLENNDEKENKLMAKSLFAHANKLPKKKSKNSYYIEKSKNSFFIEESIPEEVELYINQNDDKEKQMESVFNEVYYI